MTSSKDGLPAASNQRGCWVLSQTLAALRCALYCTVHQDSIQSHSTEESTVHVTFLALGPDRSLYFTHCTYKLYHVWRQGFTRKRSRGIRSVWGHCVRPCARCADSVPAWWFATERECKVRSNLYTHTVFVTITTASNELIGLRLLPNVKRPTQASHACVRQRALSQLS